MSLLELKVFSAIVIFLIAVSAAIYPFLRRVQTTEGLEFPIGEALACGVFLGAGLIHMLADANQGFHQLGYQYPFAFLLAGSIFLTLLWLEHFGKETYHHQGEQSLRFVLLAVMLLSLHALLAGAALGLSHGYSVFVMILIAILAHKWASSFALAIQITKSTLTTRQGFSLFLLFALMTPLGILSGSLITSQLQQIPYAEPIALSLAAGTFIYLGTLHGLNKAILIQKCCNPMQFIFVIIGFGLMALVANWA